MRITHAYLSLQLMYDNGGMAKTTVSSRYQITLPAEVRKVLGIRPGDKLEVELVDGEIRLRIPRPPLERVLKRLQKEHGASLAALGKATGHDARQYVRQLRERDTDG